MRTHQSKSRTSAPAGIPNPGISHMLVPLDFSGKSRQALVYALPLARHFRARISLLHVIELPTQPAESGGFVINVYQDVRPQRQAAARRLEQMAARLVPKELRGHNLIGIGSASGVIIDTIRRQHIDMVVLSTKGRSGLARIVLGSTAEYVVRHAACPVLTIRRK